MVFQDVHFRQHCGLGEMLPVIGHEVRYVRFWKKSGIMSLTLQISLLAITDQVKLCLGKHISIVNGMCLPKLQEQFPEEMAHGLAE